jgi:flagellar protein FlaF
MYESVLAKQSYANPSRSTATPRSIEYEAFARVTAQLTSASRNASAELAPLAQALQDNLNLWTVLGTDVAGAGNGLPVELRAKLFYLFEFTRSHTVKVLNGEATAGALIDINTAIMRGLRSSVRPEAAE